MPEENLEQSAKLMRKLLGSIDLSDIEELQKVRLTPEELKARAGDFEGFYRNHFEKVLKLFIWKQLEAMAKIGADVQFSRGTINGFFLIRDLFDEQVDISLSRFEKEEKPEPGESIPRL